MVALATLMYEILLTRIFSVTMLYHFAFVALSVAMFGMTVGALIVYLCPRIFIPARLHQWLAVAALAFPIAMVLSFLTQLSVPFRIHPSIVAIYAIGFTYAVIAVPFVVSGIVVCLSLTGFPSRVSRLYAADLAGAAVGCVLLIPVLDYSDGPTAVLWVSFLASFGAIAFAASAGRRARRAAIAVSVLLLIAAAGHTVLVWKHFPVFRILYIKGIVRSAAALREVELVLARQGEWESERVRRAPGLGAQPRTAARPARPPAPDGHRRRRRDGHDRLRRQPDSRAAPRLRRDESRLPRAPRRERARDRRRRRAGRPVGAHASARRPSWRSRSTRTSCGR